MTEPSSAPAASEERHPLGPLLAPFRHRVHAALDRLPAPLAEFVLFGLKQAWACLFAALMLALLIGTDLVWRPDWPVYRYDALLFAALLIQFAFLALDPDLPCGRDMGSYMARVIRILMRKIAGSG